MCYIDKIYSIYLLQPQKNTRETLEKPETEHILKLLDGCGG